MSRTTRSCALAGLLVALLAVLTPPASATVTPTLTLNQSAGKTAGSTANLGMDLKFSDSGSDSPDQMTINLPPGLLANASIDGGACLTTTDLSDTKCQVGTGTVTADPISFPLLPISENVTFDLVPPPAAGDLAGLAVNSSGTQIGSTAGIVVRPSGDPDGVGVTINLTLPDSLDGFPISITEIDSTFDGLRYPTTCPATPANVSVSVNSYDDATPQTVTAPLSVTGCGALPYAPQLSLSAVKDSTDRQVKLTATVTQAADEAPSRSLSLAFTGNTLLVNTTAGGIICKDIASGSCMVVGTATAVSPLYPKALSANAYLTGTLVAPTLTLVFPPPFPLTLVGSVNLTTKASSFTGLPDIPLTSLSLTLNSGSFGLFATNCSPLTGVATATSTDQNGDKSVSGSAGYTVVGCPPRAVKASGAGNGRTPRPRLSALRLRGLSSGHPTLSFALAAAAAAKLTRVTVEPPSGFGFIASRAGHRLRISGVTVTGARIRSLSLSHGALVITLRSAATHLRVKIAKALTESPSVRAKARHGKVRNVHVTVLARTGRGKSYTLSGLIRRP